MLRLFKALFRKKTKDQPASDPEKRASSGRTTKTADTASKTRAKSQVETEAEAEQRIRSAALEIKGCIDLINSTGKDAPGKPKAGRADPSHKGDDRTKPSNRKSTCKGPKTSKQGASPAEMIMLLEKAGKNVSEAVVKAKENDQKNKQAEKKKKR
jgi:hypothetical protein